MKLTKQTKQTLVTLIEEAMDEPINFGSPDYNAGLRDGNRRSAFLFKKREKQSAKGLKNYIAKATEHRTASYKAGYRFAFELRFSAVLGDPIPDGQLPYANTRPSKPSTLFDQPRGKNPLYTLEEEHAKAALDKKEKRNE